MKYHIEIPGWHPARLNRLMFHKGRCAGLKKHDLEIIKRALLVNRVTVAIGRRRVGLTIQLGRGQRAADPDAYWKSTLDALVRCGVLKDDSRTWCELLPILFERTGNKGAVIGIEDLD